MYVNKPYILFAILLLLSLQHPKCSECKGGGRSGGSRSSSGWISGSKSSGGWRSSWGRGRIRMGSSYSTKKTQYRSNTAIQKQKKEEEYIWKAKSSGRVPHPTPSYHRIFRHYEMLNNWDTKWKNDVSKGIENNRTIAAS